MNAFDKLLNRIDERTIIIFSVGLIGGVISAILQLFVRTIVVPAFHTRKPAAYSFSTTKLALDLTLQKNNNAFSYSENVFQLSDIKILTTTYRAPNS